MAEYFSHDYSARNDRKMVALRKKEGMAGVGVYWSIVEMLYEEGGYISLTQLENIGFELRTKPATIRRIVCDYELFSVDGEKFCSESALNRLKKRNSIVTKRKKSAKTRWNKEKQDANALQTQSKSSAIKGKEIKENEKKGEREIPPTPKTNFGDVCDDYVLVGGHIGGDGICRVNGAEGLKEYLEHQGSVLTHPALAEKFMRNKRGNKYNEMMHLKNTFNLFVEKQYA